MPNSISDPIQSSVSPKLGQTTMSSQPAAQCRRPSPGPVQTNLNNQYPTATPTSAISTSSVASNSQQGSPIMSPEPVLLTTHSSVQASPEPLRPRDEDSYPSSFQLPESIVSRKTSLASLGQSWTGSPSSAAEAVFSSFAANATPPPPNKGSSIIRRLSSRASRRITSRRRQSSAAPGSRDTSVGPCYLRRRSDSNNTAPPDFSAAGTDSESDADERDDMISFRSANFYDGAARESSANSTTGSISGSSNTMAGPVIPLQLQRGTWVRKVSKKKRARRVCLVYDPETNRISWDRTRLNKFLHVDEVREIRTGSDIQQYGRDFNIPEAERSTWFSILYSVPDKSRSKFLHVIAEDAETFHLWTTFLEAMLKHRQEVMISLMTFNERAIAQYWQTEMQRHNSEDQEELDISGVMRVCQNLHIYSSVSTLQSNFRLADARRHERLNFEEFLDFIRLLRQRQDVQSLMHHISKRAEAGITLEEFLAFLRDIQGEKIDINRAAWEKLFFKFVRKHRNDDVANTDPIPDEMNIMSETAFIGFLGSRHNMPVVEEPQEYTLDRPMNEYFISSSHNTYLLGRQVAGQSSIEGYISALVRGCRCVEVDCWDGPDGQPLVVHGRTMTTSISFKEVMTTINKYAFLKSKFPLWISLEVHCNPTQQAIMAETIKDAFGARLVTEPLDPSSTELPSPSQLMERVLIKVKQPRINKDESAVSEGFIGRRRGNSLNSPLVRPTIPDANGFSSSQSLPQSPLLTPSNPTRRLVGKTRVNTITEGQVPEKLIGSNSDTESGSDYGSSRGSNNIVPVLGKLGVYCAGLKFSGFDVPAAKNFNHIFSFMESSFAKNSRSKEEKRQLDRHNMRYLMRVYPDGTRVGSSNFDPLTYWRRGVQMAAVNWQTFDMGMQVNQAMFEGGTDFSGYVLKPDELREIQVFKNETAESKALAEGKKERSVVSFGIDVLSAQQLMRPANLAANKSMDFYVQVDVFHANDKRDKKEAGSELRHEPDSPLRVQTEIIRENAFNPMFRNGSFRFKVTTKHPELVFVRWSVRLASDAENAKERPPMASYTAKLNKLRQGYRTLPLLNNAGEQYLFSSLFCKIEVDPIEKIFVDAPQPVPEVGSKLNRFGGKVFGRTNTSPRSTMEKSSIEKQSFESF